MQEGDFNSPQNLVKFERHHALFLCFPLYFPSKSPQSCTGALYQEEEQLILLSLQMGMQLLDQISWDQKWDPSWTSLHSPAAAFLKAAVTEELVYV